MAKILLNEKIKKDINQYVHRVIDSGIPVDKVILFGSYVKGKANTYSDIDLAIVSKDFGRRRVLEMKKLRRIAYRSDSLVEPLPLNPKDLNEKYSALISEIKTHGQVIPF